MYFLGCCLLLAGVGLSEAMSPFQITLPGQIYDQQKSKHELLEEDIASLNNTLTAINKKMNSFAADISGSTNTGNLEGIIKTFEEKQAELSTQLTSLSTIVNQGSSSDVKVSKLEEAITGIEASVAGLMSDVDSLRTNQNHLEDDTVNGLETSVSGLQTTQKMLQNQLKQVVESMQEMETKIALVTTVQAEIDTLKSTQTKLETDTNQLASTVNNRHIPDVSGLEASVETLTKILQTSSEEIATLTDSLSSLQQKFDELSTSTTELSTKQSQLSALDLGAKMKQLTVLQANVDTMANDLAAVNVNEVESKLTARIDAITNDVITLKDKTERERTTDKQAHADDIDSVNQKLTQIETSIGPVQGTLTAKADTKLQFFENKLTFTAANTYCKNLGGTLAILDTKEKTDKALSEASGYYTWVGFSRQSSSGPFYWIDTTDEVTGVYWKSGHPRRGERCGLIAVYNGKVYFKTDSCDTKMKFLCDA